MNSDFEEEKKSKYDIKPKLVMIEHLSMIETDLAKNPIEQLKVEIESHYG